MRTKVDTDPGSGADPDGVLAQLAAVRRERSAIERREATLVRRARNEGIVWEQIAASLGVSKQAVHRKYAGRNTRRRRGATLNV
jgi:hypothetical protein